MTQGHVITFQLDLDPGHGSSVGCIWRLLAETGSSMLASSCPARGFGDNPSSKDLNGTAKTSADEKETKLAAAFHAALK